MTTRLTVEFFKMDENETKAVVYIDGKYGTTLVGVDEAHSIRELAEWFEEKDLPPFHLAWDRSRSND